MHRDAAQVIDHEQLIFVGPGPDLAPPIVVIDDENTEMRNGEAMTQCRSVCGSRRMQREACKVIVGLLELAALDGVEAVLAAHLNALLVIAFLFDQPS